MNRTYILTLLFFSTLFAFNTQASHIVGGEVSYDTVGVDGNGDMVYHIRFELFRDCNTSVTFPGDGFGAPFHFTIFDNANAVFLYDTIAFAGANELPLVYDDPCVEPPDDICIESAIYDTIIALPIIAGDYTISYQVGNWSADYINFDDPGGTGMTIATTIPGTNTVGNVANNSPRFEDYPQIVFCLNTELVISNNMIEEDGDSLAFKLCDPLQLSGTNINPNPEDPPPYNSVIWEPGFSASAPFENASPTNMDAITGNFSVTPSLLGKFAARFCVEEWRDGVLISTHSRTFGYNIVECISEPAFEINVLGGGNIIEGCGGVSFIIERNDTIGDLPLIVETSGDAVMGVNYTNLPDTIFIPEGVTNDTIDVNTIYQSVEEGDLTGTVYILYLNPCTGDLDTAFTSFVIQDYYEMELIVNDSINICAENNDVFTLTPETLTGGVEPYYYLWSSYVSAYPNNDTIYVDANILEDNYNEFTLTVFDQCGYEVESGSIGIYEQCPIVVPNIITPNQDGSNDFFKIKNSEDYDRIELQILNRWGNLIYENADYQDDWNGVNQNGLPVSEGVYFYTVIPSGDKYEYREDDQPFLLHGFVHVVR
jgi:gliding motility-associated-like protein